MPRPAPAPRSHLGIAVQRQRADLTQAEAAAMIGIPETTLSRVERGAGRPSYETARALAAWLGWSLERVLEAAESPAEKEKIEES